MIWNKGQITFPETTRYYQCFEYMFVFTKGKIKTHNQISDRKNKCYGQLMHGTDRQKDGTMTEKSAIKLKNQRKVKEFGVRYNIWNISPATQNRTGHPAVFPEQLAEDHIISWSNENDIVMDIFSGSGTTHKMALKNHRKFIGFEISQEYVDIEEQRIKDCDLWCYDENYKIIKNREE